MNEIKLYVLYFYSVCIWFKLYCSIHHFGSLFKGIWISVAQTNITVEIF